MAIFRSSSVRVAQPPFPEIDHSQPIARGIEAAFIPNATSGVLLRDISGHGRHATKVTTETGSINFTKSAPLRGVAIDFQSAGSDLDYYKAPLPSSIDTFTMFGVCAIGTKSVGNGQTLMSYTVDGTGNDRVTLGADNIPDQWGVWDNSNGWLRATSAQEENYVPVSAACIYSGTAVRTVYYKGKLEATDNFITSVASASKTHLFMGIEDTSVSESWDGLASVFYFFSRALAPAEIAALHANPYRILKPENRYYSLGGASVAPLAYHHFMKNLA